MLRPATLAGTARADQVLGRLQWPQSSCPTLPLQAWKLTSRWQQEVRARRGLRPVPAGQQVHTPQQRATKPECTCCSYPQRPALLAEDALFMAWLLPKAAPAHLQELNRSSEACGSALMCRSHAEVAWQLPDTDCLQVLQLLPLSCAGVGEGKEAKEKPEPNSFTVDNPARVVPAQERFVSFPPDGRHQPIQSRRTAGILIMRDTKPGGQTGWQHVLP